MPNLPTIARRLGGDHVLALSESGYEVYAWGCGEKGQLGMGDIEWSKKTSKGYLKPTKPWTIRLPTYSANGPSAGAPDAKTRLQRALNENFLACAREVASDASADMRDACEMYTDHATDLRTSKTLDDHPVEGGLLRRIPLFAISIHGNVYSFGLNNMGQLGLGSLDVNSTGVPTLVTALEGKGIAHLEGGEHHSIALSDTGEVYTLAAETTISSATAMAPTSSFRRGGCPRSKASPSARCRHRRTPTWLSKSGDLYSWGSARWGSCAMARVPTRRSRHSSRFRAWVGWRSSTRRLARSTRSWSRWSATTRLGQLLGQLAAARAYALSSTVGRSGARPCSRRANFAGGRGGGHVTSAQAVMGSGCVGKLVTTTCRRIRHSRTMYCCIRRRDGFVAPGLLCELHA